MSDRDVLRAKELFSYFESDETQSFTLSKESAVVNKALSPHLQLLALQCNAVHVFVSVFDRESLYIIAEHNASNTTPTFRFDCAGKSMEGRICTYTLEMPCTEEQPQPIFEVSDLLQDHRFSNYPFVCDPKGPGYRYYAGVPLIVGKGPAIGTVAILATIPRDSLSCQAAQALRDIATSISDVLDLRRQAANGMRLGALATNLSYFVADIPPSQNCLKQSEFASSAEPTVTTTRGYTVQNTDGIFQRAVKSIQTALKLDGDSGVLFLKARTPSFSPTFEKTTEENMLDTSYKRIIACSESIKNKLDMTSSSTISKLNTLELKPLLNEFSHGHSWQYDTHGLLLASETDIPYKRVEAREASSCKDLSWPSWIRNVCSAVKQILLIPMLDAALGEWHAACFVWIANAERSFNRADIGLLVSYGQAIMAQCAMQDALTSTLQKTDFIGSISHELRTPLHGILTSLELVKEEKLSHFQSSMIETIQTCSQTLLDTVNHILSFSKINTFKGKDVQASRESGSIKKGSEYLRPMGAGTSTRSTDEFHNLIEVIDVGATIEDIADMVYVDSLLIRDLPTNGTRQTPGGATLASTRVEADHGRPLAVSQNVEMILDIAHEDWRFSVDTGAFKRLVVNILGNAFKYTQHGVVHVSVKLDNSINDGTTEGLILKVTDSGCGISESFLQTRLFMPFAQEDSLTSGIGLGLSICHAIVTNLGGQIAVASKVNSGTTVTVLFPLNRSGLPAVAINRPAWQSAYTGKYSAESPQYTYVHPPSQTTNDPDNGTEFSMNFCRYLTHWYQFDKIPLISSKEVDLIVLESATLKVLSHIQVDRIREKDSAVLIIAERLADRSSVQNLVQRLGFSNVTTIYKPCGPAKIAKALNTLFPHSNNTLNQQSKRGRRPRADKEQMIVFDSGLKSQYSGMCSCSRCVLAALSLVDTQLSPDESSCAYEDRGSNISDQTLSTQPSSCQSDVGDSYFPNLSGFTLNVLQDPGEKPQCSNSNEHQNQSPISPIRNQSNTRRDMARNPRFLLVDDNRINLRLLEAFCKKQAYKSIETAVNGKIALDLVLDVSATQPFDIIFMDISMPVMNGFEATIAIRNHEEKHAVQPAVIIALTGLANERDRIGALAVGMDFYFTKPVKFTEVKHLLESLVKPS